MCLTLAVYWIIRLQRMNHELVTLEIWELMKIRILPIQPSYINVKAFSCLLSNSLTFLVIYVNKKPYKMNHPSSKKLHLKIGNYLTFSNAIYIFSWIFMNSGNSKINPAGNTAYEWLWYVIVISFSHVLIVFSLVEVKSRVSLMIHSQNNV